MKRQREMTGREGRSERRDKIVAMASCCAALLGLGVGCSPGGDVDPASNKFFIYNLDRETGDYRLVRESIRTLQDVRAVDGEVVEMRGGGELTSGTDDPQTRADWEKVLLIKDSETPSIEYTVDDDGTVVPWDFDSAMMLTVYHHIERSRTYFDEVMIDDALRQDLGGGIGERVGKLPCYYYPQITLGGIPLPLFTDNAAYAFTLNAFLVPPRRQFVEAVPIYANRGVITHEYGHAVFNRLVHDNERVPDYVFEQWDQQGGDALIALNEMGGLDEGVADIWGALDTQDPNFIAATVSEELIDRDMSKPRFYEECLHLAVITGTYPLASECGGNYGDTVANPTDSQGVRFDYSAGGDYDSHHLGAVVASVFWALRAELSGTVSDAQWGPILARALRAIKHPTTDFRVVDFFDALHDSLPAEAKSSACLLFKERLIVIRDELQCT